MRSRISQIIKSSSNKWKLLKSNKKFKKTINPLTKAIFRSKENQRNLTLLLPLTYHGGRTGDDDLAHTTAQEEFRGDEARLDGLAETDVIRDEEVHTRQLEGFAERLQLIGFDLDACTEGSLEELGIGGSDAVPAEGMEVGAEPALGVESPVTDGAPDILIHDPGIGFKFPDDIEQLSLCIIIQAGDMHEGTISGTRFNALDKIGTHAHMDDMSGLWGTTMVLRLSRRRYFTKHYGLIPLIYCLPAATTSRTHEVLFTPSLSENQ